MNITVATLIYKSPTYLDFVMNSLLEHTNSIHNIEYLIVCNDATDDVIIKASEYASELSKNYNPKINVVSHRNNNPNEWWINRVYNAWNRCIEECNTEAICFVNSDMAFTDGWLDALARFDLNKYIPTSRLVESERMPSLPGLISRNFGQTIGEFDRYTFEQFAEEIKNNSVCVGVGAYMPSLFYVDVLKDIGGWHKNYGNVPGDRITFGMLNKTRGLRHIMVNDSIVYHLQRGESVECGDL